MRGEATRRTQIRKPAWVCEPKNGTVLQRQRRILCLCRPSQETRIRLSVHPHMWGICVNTICATCTLTRRESSSGGGRNACPLPLPRCSVGRERCGSVAARLAGFCSTAVTLLTWAGPECSWVTVTRKLCGVQLVLAL